MGKSRSLFDWTCSYRHVRTKSEQSDHWTYPNPLHVVCDTICWNTLVIRGFEKRFSSSLSSEALSKLNDGSLKLVCSKNLETVISS